MGRQQGWGGSRLCRGWEVRLLGTWAWQPPVPLHSPHWRHSPAWRPLVTSQHQPATTAPPWGGSRPAAGAAAAGSGAQSSGRSWQSSWVSWHGGSLLARYARSNCIALSWFYRLLHCGFVGPAGNVLKYKTPGLWFCKL